MHLRHGEDRALGGDAKAAIDRDAATTAHGDAVNQGDIGFGKTVDTFNEAILFAEKIGLVVTAPALLSRIVNRAHVAAGAKGAVAGTAHEDRLDALILAPSDKLRIERPVHRQGERIERLRPVERDDAEPATALEQDFVVAIHIRRTDQATRYAAHLSALGGVEVG